MTPDREPRLPRREPLRVILEKLEFAVGVRELALDVND